MEIPNYFQKIILNQQTSLQKVVPWVRISQGPSLATPLVLQLVPQLPLRESALS